MQWRNCWRSGMPGDPGQTQHWNQPTSTWWCWGSTLLQRTSAAKKKARVPERPLSLMKNMLVLECLESGNPELGHINYETPTWNVTIQIPHNTNSYKFHQVPSISANVLNSAERCDVRWNPQKVTESESIPSTGLIFHGTCAAVMNLRSLDVCSLAAFCFKNVMHKYGSQMHPNACTVFFFKVFWLPARYCPPPYCDTIKLELIHHVIFAGKLCRCFRKVLLTTIA